MMSRCRIISSRFYLSQRNPSTLQALPLSRLPAGSFPISQSVSGDAIAAISIQALTWGNNYYKIVPIYGQNYRKRALEAVDR